MAWSRDITGVDAAKKGTYRSLNGAADENIFIGRASKAGFYCFFKAWRDMQYDAVLDYEGILYRVEVKGSSNSQINVTRGTRSGKQIKKGSRLNPPHWPLPSLWNWIWMKQKILSGVLALPLPTAASSISS